MTSPVMEILVEAKLIQLCSLFKSSSHKLKSCHKLLETYKSLGYRAIYRKCQFMACYRPLVTKQRYIKLLKNLHKHALWLKNIFIKSAPYYLLHTGCRKLKRFWEMIKGWLERVIMRTINLDPLVFILGNKMSGLKNPSQRMAKHILTAARRLIAKDCKSSYTPIEQALHDRINTFAEWNT